MSLALSWPICHTYSIPGLFQSSHGPEEAPAVLQLGAGHIGEVGKVVYCLSHSQCALPTQFQVFRAFPWTRRGPCGTPTWSWSPGEVGQLCHWLPCSQYELPAMFQISGATYKTLLTFEEIQTSHMWTCVPKFHFQF